VVPSYEYKLFLGRRYRDEAKSFRKRNLKSKVKNFQELFDEKHNTGTIPVRLSETTFVARDYAEDGFEVAVINYPRRPRKEEEIRMFMLGLAGYLLTELRQNRICVVGDKNTYMVQTDEDALDI
jgi:hypothetical protein